MKTFRIPCSRRTSLLIALLFFLDGPRLLMAEPSRAAVAAFHAYCETVESRLARQHRSQGTFLALPTENTAQVLARLRGGEVMIEQVRTPEADVAGAMMHHWRGTAFIAGATPADFERLMRNFDAYPQHFAPQVLAARTISSKDDRLEAWMRVRQRHVITVVMDATYDIVYGHLDGRHGYSISRSTQIEEMEPVAGGGERALGPDEEHGFLWALNTYWSYEERDGGLYVQIEAVSLTRSIPRGLGWVVGPFVESVPRESLAFTLHAACEALRR